MNIGLLYDRIASSSPYIELAIRYLYWHNVRWLKTFKNASSFTAFQNPQAFSFEEVLNFLSEENVDKYEIVIVHSSYDVIKGCGLNPKEIVDRLISFLGSNVTLAMPVIRQFKEEPQYEDLLNVDTSDIVRTYDVRRTPVISGIIPYTLMRRQGAITSKFPLNPLTAIGPLAEEMMEHNLDGEFPSAHGPNSCWGFCLNHNTVIIHLGVDANHHMTMIHATEETPDWPISKEKWFDKRRFIIKDGNDEFEKTISERKLKWQLLDGAEKFQGRLMHEAGIIHEKEIGGIMFSVTKSHDIQDFMTEIRKRYPTFPNFLCNKY